MKSPVLVEIDDDKVTTENVEHILIATKHKNRYEEVIEEFLSECEEQGYACEDIRSCMQETLEAVAKLSYTIKGNRAPMIRK